MVKEMDYYNRLEVPSNASLLEIKKAYRRLALLKHPDKGGTAEEFKKLSQAYEILQDPVTRQQYDLHGSAPSNTPGLSEDVFSNLMKEMHLSNPFAQFFGSFVAEKLNPVPAPIRLSVDVSLEQIALKQQLEVKYSRKIMCNSCYKNSYTCPRCSGVGFIPAVINLGIFIHQTNEKCHSCINGKIYNPCSIAECSAGFVLKNDIILLTLQPDICVGSTLSFKGVGNQSDSGRFGDCIINFNIIPHPLFKLEKYNIILEKTITLKQALTRYIDNIKHPNGADISINTIGFIISNESEFTVKDRGMIPGSDFKLKFKVEFPSKLTPEQRTALLNIL
jgi:DnaJ family protein A protein 2